MRTSGEYLFDLLFFSITPNYPIFGASGKPGAVHWALARDDRSWGGEDPPGVVYFYADGRGGKHAEEFLKGFKGILQVDAYGGYNRLTKDTRADGALTLEIGRAHV